jgi:exo-1,4-beta-D-glucosaminidase
MSHLLFSACLQLTLAAPAAHRDSESHRAMFEGYSVRKYNGATGLIQWMLNSAWPSNMWHLFDFYLQTGGSYFGVKKAASRPLHLAFSYDRDATLSGGTISVVNSRYVQADGAGLSAEATQFDLAGSHLRTQTLPLGDVAADSARSLFSLVPAKNSSSSTILLRLRLAGRPECDDNWYWLPSTPDKFEMGGCFTGCVIDQFANMQDIGKMPVAPQLTVTVGKAVAVGGHLMQRLVTVRAGAAALDGGKLAFFVRLRALDSHGNDVLPATWSDNFLTLLSGQSVTIELEYEQDSELDTVSAAPFNSPLET